MAKAKQPTVQQWSVPMRVEHQTFVLVEACTMDDAKAAARDLAWLDDGLNVAELVNWEVTGNPKVD